MPAARAPFPDSTPRGRTGAPGIGIAVGVVLVAAGAAVALLAAGVLPSRTSAPRPVVGGIGAFLTLAGLTAVLQGARELGRRRRAAAVLARHPGEPWRADHAWDPRGARDERGRDGRRALVGGLLLAAFVGCIATLVVGREGAAGMVPAAVLGLFGAGALVLAAYGALVLARCARHGPAELRFGRFPFVLGEPLEAELVRPPGAPRLGRVEVTLLCIEERLAPEPARDDANAGRSRLERVERWRAEQILDGAATGSGRIPIRVELPPDRALSTALSANPPRYWELAVVSRRRGLDLGARFVVPVYARVPEVP